MCALQIVGNLLSCHTSQLTLLDKRCLRTRLNTNECRRCLTNCTPGALGLNGRKITYDEHRCTGCMACVSVCPQDAVISNYDQKNLIGECAAGRKLFISCTRQQQDQPEEHILPCVGIISSELLAYLFTSELAAVEFNLAGCETCCNAHAAKSFSRNCELIEKNLTALGLPRLVPLQLKKKIPATSQGDRKAYLAEVRRMVATVSSIPRAKSDMVQKSKPSATRRVSFATKLRGKIAQTLEDQYRKSFLELFCHALEVSDNCDCCPQCKGICPTGAITVQRSEQGKTLVFKQLKCSGCGLCEEFCKKHALTLQQSKWKRISEQDFQ